MPLTLSRGGISCSRLKPHVWQDLIRLLHKPSDDSQGTQIRCLPRRGGRHNRDAAVQRLTYDVDQLDSENPDSSEDGNSKGEHPHNYELRRTLSEDVQKQLHLVLAVIKEITAEKGERLACQRHMPTEDAVELLEHFIAADLPVHLLEHLPHLEFEARKDVMNIFCALLWPGMPQQIDRQVLEYLRYHPRIFSLLIEGYANEEAAMHYGVVLRSCARHKELVDAFLKSQRVFELIYYARHPSIDISSDAFYSLREVLLEHKEVSAAWLEQNFQEFFSLYNELLRSDDYMVERQALTLLAAMLLDRNFKRVMLAYVNSDLHLQLQMNLLRDTSKAIQVEAFHVFKIFVANPQKPVRVQLILYKNKEKLVKLLETLHALRPDDKRFCDDQKTVIQRLLDLPRPQRQSMGAAGTSHAPGVAGAKGPAAPVAGKASEPEPGAASSRAKAAAAKRGG